MDGKTLLDLIIRGIKARDALRTGFHTDSERQRVRDIEAELTAFLNPQMPEAPDAHETED